MIVIVSS